MYNKSNNKSAKPYTKPVVVKVPRQIRKWSDLQEAVFDNLKNSSGNLQVDARAGSGKTATLVECTFLIPSSKTVLACAFNTTIKDELETRVREGVNVATMHSIGFSALKYKFGKDIFVDNNKLFGNFDRLINDRRRLASINPSFNEVNFDDLNSLRSEIKKAVEFSKYNLAASQQDIINILAQYRVEVDSNILSEDMFIGLVYELLNISKQNVKVVDFADMIWLPIVMNCSFIKYDYVFVDETQDLNKCQTEIALRSCKANGRIITFGDEFQAIYSFAGADHNSIPNIVSRLNSTRLPLSVSYRCPKKVIEQAQQIVKDIQHAPNAIDGEVLDLEEAKILDFVKPGDVILSRVNAKLISLCMKLLKMKIPANIVGRDIGEGLLSLVKKSKAKSIQDLINYVDNWKANECEKLSKKDRDATHIIDKADCITNLAEDCSSIDELVDAINKLFSDKQPSNIVTLSSIHRYKGRESKNVFVIASTLRTGKSQEETNIAYVGFTRALEKMYLVS